MELRITTLLIGGLAAAGGMAALHFWHFQRRFVPILLYHYFTEGASANLLEVPLKAFSRQLRLLRALGFRCISLSALLNERVPHQRAVVITADDGEISLFEKALPLLRDFNFPLTSFVVVDFLSKGYFEAGGKRRMAATWEQLRGLLSSYPELDIGCHSWSHRALPACSISELGREICDSAEALYEGLGRMPQNFAYPFGRWNPAVTDQVRAAGYLAACATTWGDSLKRNQFQLEREPIYANTNLWQFALKLFGCYSFARNLPGLRCLRGRRWRFANNLD
jgi:peptidoglycan/xylan/chitin deacetylase (PgdA/CDA1 family)